MDDGRDHRRIRAAAGPDGDALGFDLDDPDFGPGPASRWLARMASGRGWCHGLYHRRYKLRIVSFRCR